MLDIAWTELIIIAIVAILVVGPRELPAMLRGIGKFMGQMRRMAGDFQRQFNDALKDTELDEVRRGFDSMRKANPVNKLKDDLNPLKGAGESMRKAIEDPGAPNPKPKPATGPKPESQSAGATTSTTTSTAKPRAPAKTATAAKKSAASKSSTSTPRKSATAPRSSGAKPAKAEADGGGGTSD